MIKKSQPSWHYFMAGWESTHSTMRTTDTVDRLLLADFLLGPAVEVIVQAFSSVACFITLAVVEDAPAVWVGAACPGVHSQGAVSTVPVTSIRVAHLVTYTVVGPVTALRQRADGLWRLQHSRFLLTAFTPPSWQALAAEEGKWRLHIACAAVITLLRQADLGSTFLALRTRIALWTWAACTSVCQGTATTIIAGQLTAGHAAFTVEPGVAL